MVRPTGRRHHFDLLRIYRASPGATCRECISIAMAKPELLYVAAGGNVVGLDASTGNELWRRPLKPSNVMTIVRHGSWLIAAAAGELWCLDAATGEVVWQNKLKGLGVGFVAIAGAAPTAHGASGGADAALAAGSAAASYASITD